MTARRQEAPTPPKPVRRDRSAEYTATEIVIPFQTPLQRFLFWVWLLTGILIVFHLIMPGYQGRMLLPEWLFHDAILICLGAFVLWKQIDSRYVIREADREILYQTANPLYHETLRIPFSELAAVAVVGRLSGWPLVYRFYSLSFTTVLVLRNGRRLEMATLPGTGSVEERLWWERHRAARLASRFGCPCMEDPLAFPGTLQEWEQKIGRLAKSGEDPAALERTFWELGLSCLTLEALEPGMVKVDLPTRREKRVLVVVIALLAAVTWIGLKAEWQFLAANPRVFYLILLDSTSIVATIFGLWYLLIDEFLVLDLRRREVRFRFRWLFYRGEVRAAGFDDLLGVDLLERGAGMKAETAVSLLCRGQTDLRASDYSSPSEIPGLRAAAVSRLTGRPLGKAIFARLTEEGHREDDDLLVTKDNEVLTGRVWEKAFGFHNGYILMSLPVACCQGVSFDGGEDRPVVVTLTDGSRLSGGLQGEVLHFRLGNRAEQRTVRCEEVRFILFGRGTARGDVHGKPSSHPESSLATMEKLLAPTGQLPRKGLSPSWEAIMRNGDRLILRPSRDPIFRKVGTRDLDVRLEDIRELEAAGESSNPWRMQLRSGTSLRVSFDVIDLLLRSGIDLRQVRVEHLVRIRWLPTSAVEPVKSLASATSPDEARPRLSTSEGKAPQPGDARPSAPREPGKGVGAAPIGPDPAEEPTLVPAPLPLPADTVASAAVETPAATNPTPVPMPLNAVVDIAALETAPSGPPVATEPTPVQVPVPSKGAVETVAVETAAIAGSAAGPAPESRTPPPGAGHTGGETASGPGPLPPQAEPLPLFVQNSAGMDFRLIAPGGFLMGSERDVWNEQPLHRVILTQPFYLSVHVVTREEYAEVMGRKTFDPRNSGGRNSGGRRSGGVRATLRRLIPRLGNRELMVKRLPKTGIGWEEVGDFCAALSDSEGITYRLPTEAEWEHACRAGTTTPFFWGSSFDSGFAVCGSGAQRGPFPVGSRNPNPWGLHDMIGNVWEWCHDRFSAYAPGESTDPQGPADGDDRVIRGGSWREHPDHCWCSLRKGQKPDRKEPTIGFRVVASLDLADGGDPKPSS